MAIVQLKNESERLKALHALRIVGSERLPEYDAVVETLAAIFDCPIALISLIDEKDQWFKAVCGIQATGTPREVSICQHAIASDDLFIVPDTLQDTRFCSNPMVLGEPFIRFYAGCPLSLDGRNRLGTLCVVDTAPRSPSPAQLNQLRSMGRVVEGLLKAHQANIEKEAALAEAAREHEAATFKGDLLEQVALVSGVGGWELCIESQKLTWTPKTRELHEVRPDYVPTVETAIGFYAPDARKAIESAVSRGIEQGKPWDLELPLTTAKGRNIWVRAAGRPVIKNGTIVKLVGAFQDITERRHAEQSIRESEITHRTTLEALSEGVLVLHRSGQIHSCNPAAADLLDRPLDQLVGRNIADLEATLVCKLGFENEEVDALRLAASDPAVVVDVAAELRHADKSAFRWLRINARQLEPESELGIDGVVVSMTDITETKRQADTLQIIFENFPGGVAHYTDTFQLASYNADFGNLLGYPEDMLRQKLHILDYLKFSAERGDYGPGEPEELALEKYRLASGRRASSYERQKADGTYLEIRYTPLPTGGAIYNFFDVTQRKKMEQDLAENEQLARNKMTELEAILANMRQGVSVFDQDGKLTLWNRQYIEIFGKPENEVKMGMSLADLIHAEKARGDFTGDVDEHVRDLVSRMSSGEVVRSKFSHSNGKVISVVHAPMPDGGWIGTHEDITLREEAAARITHAANHDDLTGLANRGLFTATLRETLVNAQVQGSGGHLLLLDLDRFKPVNDTYGHDVGDELLRQVSKRFLDCVRSSDLVARIGGDEFAIILRGTRTPKERVTEVVERIIRAINAPFDVFAHSVSIGVSIGVAEIEGTSPTAEAILKQADIALYDVKQNGRNSFRYYEDCCRPKIVRGNVG